MYFRFLFALLWGFGAEWLQYKVDLIIPQVKLYQMLPAATDLFCLLWLPSVITQYHPYLSFTSPCCDYPIPPLPLLYMPLLIPPYLDLLYKPLLIPPLPLLYKPLLWSPNTTLTSPLHAPANTTLPRSPLQAPANTTLTSPLQAPAVITQYHPYLSFKALWLPDHPYHFLTSPLPCCGCLLWSSLLPFPYKPFACCDCLLWLPAVIPPYTSKPSACSDCLLCSYPYKEYRLSCSSHSFSYAEAFSHAA